jgi:hypothetical protein
MDCCGDARASAQRIFQVNGPVVFLQQIPKRFIRQFLKVLHLIVAEQVELPQGLFVELHAFTWHCRALARLTAPPVQASIFRSPKSSAEQKKTASTARSALI